MNDNVAKAEKVLRALAEKEGLSQPSAKHREFLIGKGLSEEQVETAVRNVFGVSRTSWAAENANAGGAINLHLRLFPPKPCLLSRCSEPRRPSEAGVRRCPVGAVRACWAGSLGRSSSRPPSPDPTAPCTRPSTVRAVSSVSGVDRAYCALHRCS